MLSFAFYLTPTLKGMHYGVHYLFAFNSLFLMKLAGRRCKDFGGIHEKIIREKLKETEIFTVISEGCMAFGKKKKALHFTTLATV